MLLGARLSMIASSAVRGGELWRDYFSNTPGIDFDLSRMLPYDNTSPIMISATTDFMGDVGQFFRRTKFQSINAGNIAINASYIFGTSSSLKKVTCAALGNNAYMFNGSTAIRDCYLVKQTSAEGLTRTAIFASNTQNDTKRVTFHFNDGIKARWNGSAWVTMAEDYSGDIWQSPAVVTDTAVSPSSEFIPSYGEWYFNFAYNGYSGARRDDMFIEGDKVRFKYQTNYGPLVFLRLPSGYYEFRFDCSGGCSAHALKYTDTSDGKIKWSAVENAGAMDYGGMIRFTANTDVTGILIKPEGTSRDDRVCSNFSLEKLN